MTQSNIIMYTTEDGVIKLEVTFDHDKVENFGGLDTLKVEVGMGSVICMRLTCCRLTRKIGMCRCG